MNIVIDREFRDLIPPLMPEEYEGLERSIVADGCRDALVLWGDILVDGHNRYEICESHGIPYQTTQKAFESRDDAKLWMMRNQLARRNLNTIQRAEIVNKCEDAVKAKAKEQQIRKPADFVLEKFPEQKPIVSRDELGAMAGISGKTYEHAVAVLKNAPAPVVDATIKNELSINAAWQVTKMEPEEQQEISRRIEHIHEEPPETNTPKAIIQDVIQHKPHVSNNSGNNEWYTPKKYVDAARRVLGGIDLDPASCAYANETVQAERFYSVEDDGLTKEWRGRVWMNPPYNAESVVKFTEKFVDEYEAGHINEGIVLVNNATETSWFVNMVNVASAIVFPRGRIRYESSTRDSLAPLQGQAFLYFGENIDKFFEAFSEIGWGAVIR